VKREPLYWPQAAKVLDALASSHDDALYNAVVGAIDLICDFGDSAEARREQYRTSTGTAVWKVAVRTARDDWVVLWWPSGTDAQIAYIGEL
jgi:hypothetical protein